MTVTFELDPVTPSGRRFAELATKHARDAAARSAAYDAGAEFPHDTFAEMQASGFLAACLPPEIGGLGVESTRDLAAGFNRLARGDGATAIAAHMHCVTVLGFARLWRQAHSGEGSLPDWAEEIIDGIGRGEYLLCVAGTEPGQTLGWFETTATPTEGGYLVHGRKAFASNSPCATHLYVMLRIPSGDRRWLNAVTVIEKDARGVHVRDDWDPLGMRASGSNSVVFDGCFVASDRILPVGPPLQSSRYWIRFFVEGNIGLIASFVGIAEAARQLAIDHATSRKSTVSGRPFSARPGVQHNVAEIDVRLATARAGVTYIAAHTDEFYAADAESPLPMREHERLMAEFQSTKLSVNRSAIEAVDFAMTVSGGSGYLTSNALSRLYRDVRAGPFMQAYSPNEAYEYIGKVALGLPPEISD